MTNITMSELKMIFTELILIGIIGMFIFFYDQSPIPEASMNSNGIFQPQVPTNTISNQTSVTPSSEETSWIESLITDTLGMPIEKAQILVVSSIVLIPLTIMNTVTAIRFLKDILTQWV